MVRRIRRSLGNGDRFSNPKLSRTLLRETLSWLFSSGVNMTNTIARISFIGVLLLTISLSLWKSSDISHATYQNLENYVGGSSTLHFTFSLLIGFLAVFNFPKWVTATHADIFGIRLLIVLFLSSLWRSSANCLSQLAPSVLMT